MTRFELDHFWRLRVLRANTRSVMWRYRPTTRREPQSDLAGFGEPRSRDEAAVLAGSPDGVQMPRSGG